MPAALNLRENVPLAPLTTLGVGGAARYFAVAKTEAAIPAAVEWAKANDLPLFILGGGSNLVVPDAGFNGLVLRVEITGVEEPSEGVFEVGAGESWDTFVSRVVSQGYAGIECLAGIPGSVGGTPVQNVGAYGQEVSETIDSVRAFDRVTHEFVEFPKQACAFRYRESRFNTDEPNRYIVTLVRFRLHKGGAPQLKYADLQKKFACTSPTLEQVAAGVREIRASKGMLLVEGDPDCRSAGSFFKNPIVDESAVARIAATTGIDVPHWPAGVGRVKLPAAWLLEHAGFVKGYGAGPVGISSKHTLALVNRGNATSEDVEKLQEQITATVFAKFGVKLEREPVGLS